MMRQGNYGVWHTGQAMAYHAVGVDSLWRQLPNITAGCVGLRDTRVATHRMRTVGEIWRYVIVPGINELRDTMALQRPSTKLDQKKGFVRLP